MARASRTSPARTSASTRVEAQFGNGVMALSLAAYARRTTCASRGTRTHGHALVEVYALSICIDAPSSGSSSATARRLGFGGAASPMPALHAVDTLWRVMNRLKSKATARSWRTCSSHRGGAARAGSSSGTSGRWRRRRAGAAPRRRARIAGHHNNPPPPDPEAMPPPPRRLDPRPTARPTLATLTVKVVCDRNVVQRDRLPLSGRSLLSAAHENAIQQG